MDFSSITTMGSFTRNMRLQTQWNIKKSKGAYTQKVDEGKKSSNVDVTNSDAKAQEAKAEKAKKQVVDKLAPYREELDRLRDSKDVDAEIIYLKVQSGKKLSSKEMEYLAKKDPQTYQKVKQIQMERAAFEERLKRCRTKDEVQQLKTTYVAQSLSSVNSIVNNPVIPKGKKLELVMQEHAKFQLILEAEREFVESVKYAQLPTQQEESEELQEENERLEEILHGKKPEETLPKEEEQESTESAEKAPQETEANKNAAADGQGNSDFAGYGAENEIKNEIRNEVGNQARPADPEGNAKPIKTNTEKPALQRAGLGNTEKAHRVYRQTETMDLELEVAGEGRKEKLHKKI